MILCDRISQHFAANYAIIHNANGVKASVALNQKIDRVTNNVVKKYNISDNDI